MAGWISLHRSILNWEWYGDVNTSRVFIHCLLRANHESRKWRGITIARGSFISSLDKLSKECGLSVSQIRTSIKKLKSTNEIASKSQAQHTVFTIVSYDSYQDNDKAVDIPVTNQSQANDKPVTTNNNDNNYNNVNNKHKKPASADVNPLDKYLKKLSLDCWPNLPSEQILIDWFDMRKRRRANVSQTVINNFAPELEKAISHGFTVDQCLSEAITRNWQGFKCEWMKNSQGEIYGANQQRPDNSLAGESERQTREIHARIAAGEFSNSPMGSDDSTVRSSVEVGSGAKDAGRVIDGEFLAVVPQNGGANR